MSITNFTRVVGPLDVLVTVNASGIAEGTPSISGNVSGSGYIVGDKLTVSDFNGGSTGNLPSGLVLTVEGIGTLGNITGLAITTAGTGGTSGVQEVTRSGGTETGTTSSYFNHTLYETGGNIVEYPNGIGAGNLHNNPADQSNSVDPRDNADNNPEITVVRTADRPQKKVQQRVVTSGGVTITVYAEPTVVTSHGPVNTTAGVAGSVVGNALRAEDINDRNRCEAAGFVWEAVSAQTGNKTAYGYCRNAKPAEITASAVTDCPAGYRLNGSSCTIYTPTYVNNASGTSNGYTKVQNCLSADLTWNYVAETCVANAAGYYSITGIHLTVPGTTGAYYPMGKVEYAKMKCRQKGYVWNKSTNTCEVDNSASLVTKDTCVNAGYVWIAGTCYNPNQFGDGMGRLPYPTGADAPYQSIPLAEKTVTDIEKL